MLADALLQVDIPLQQSPMVYMLQVPGAAPAGSSLKSEGTAEAAEAAIASEQAQQQHQVAGSEASAMDAVDGADEDLAQVCNVVRKLCMY